MAAGSEVLEHAFREPAKGNRRSLVDMWLVEGRNLSVTRGGPTYPPAIVGYSRCGTGKLFASQNIAMRSSSRVFWFTHESERPPSGLRHSFGQAIVGFVTHFQCLEFEEFGLGLLLCRLRLLDLTQKLCDRALEIVASDRRRPGVGRIGEMGGVGDTGALLFVGDLAIEVAGHARKLGQHHLDLANTAALLLKLKALQTNKRVPRLHSGALLNNPRRERTSRSSGHAYETAARCMTKVSSFLRQGRRVRRLSVDADIRFGTSGKVCMWFGALGVLLPGSLTIESGRGVERRDSLLTIFHGVAGFFNLI